jgi:hypothetical protein
MIGSESQRKLAVPNFSDDPGKTVEQCGGEVYHERLLILAFASPSNISLA